MTKCNSKACKAQKISDRLFVQEIINDLHKNGFVKGGKADQMLNDWSLELRNETQMKGKTKRTFKEVVGIENY